jgi:ABC-type methionine transport system ATPase subunit
MSTLVENWAKNARRYWPYFRPALTRADQPEPSSQNLVSLFCVEATSALDAETEATISESLALLKGHTILIVVAHRLSTVQKANVLQVVNRGRIFASGSFQERNKGSPLVKKYVQLMSTDLPGILIIPLGL